MIDLDPELLKKIAIDLGIEDPDKIIQLFLELVGEEERVAHMARPGNVIRRLEAHIDADLGVEQ